MQNEIHTQPTTTTWTTTTTPGKKREKKIWNPCAPPIFPSWYCVFPHFIYTDDGVHLQFPSPLLFFFFLLFASCSCWSNIDFSPTNVNTMKHWFEAQRINRSPCDLGHFSGIFFHFQLMVDWIERANIYLYIFVGQTELFRSQVAEQIAPEIVLDCNVIMRPA